MSINSKSYIRARLYDGTDEAIINSQGQLPVLVYASLDPNETQLGHKRALHIDNTSHALITCNYYDHELMRGHVFMLNSYESVGAGAHKYLYVEAPASPSASEYFIRWKVSGEDEFSVQMHYNPTLDDYGHVPSGNGIVVNRLFGSSNTTDLIVKEDCTIGGGSAGLITSSFYGSSGRKAGGVLEGEPVIVSAGIKFLVDITNQAAQANVISWNIEWFEQTPKDQEPE